MTIPSSYGAGIAYRHSDRLTVALDVYRTEWSRFVLTDASGNQTNPLTTLPLSEGRSKDTTQVRLGSEYLLIGEKTVVPLRAGLFYDPEPNGTRRDDYFGFSLGSGIAYDKYIFDISYQFRFGNNTGSDIPNQGISSDVRQHTLMTSLIYHFK
jgi:long-subunit fatty acid transport protein